jgi:hypothetical protein
VTDRPRVVVHASPIDDPENEVYTVLSEALRNEGLAPEIVGFEREPGRMYHLVDEITIFVFEHLGDAIIDLIVLKLADAIGKAKGRRRDRSAPVPVRVIYGPDGEIIREVEIPPTAGKQNRRD